MSHIAGHQQGPFMYFLAVIPFAVAAFWLVVVVLRLRDLNARLRANLAGCAGYPAIPRFRHPAGLVPGVPLRNECGGVAEASFRSPAA